MFELGIDDAGRGPVIGPMALAGTLIKKDDFTELKKLGVKDSKQLTSKRREFLAEKIREVAKSFEVVIATPKEIDESLKNGINLNELEAIKVAEIINKINSSLPKDSNKKIKVVIDCPSVSIAKWSDTLKTKIENLYNLEICCEHKADKNHVSVSSASILAKSRRESEMDKLKEKFGEEIGSGYPSDPNTKKFLEKNHSNPKFNDIFRKSWATWKNASSASQQKKLV